MPDMPEVQEDMEFSVADVPTREGEQRFQAGLNLEDQRRKESIIEELRAQLKQMEGKTQGEIRKYSSSPSARRRQITARKKIEELQKLTYRRDDRWEGPCSPSTVINLNPVPVKLQGELQRWSIPAAGKGETVELNFRGRKFSGSYLTIRTPHLYPAHTGTNNDKQTGIDMPAVDYLYVSPIGLAHQFYSHFVEGSQDAQYMGGIIIFEGDIHTLEPKRLARQSGKIWVPKKEITLDGFGDVVYTVEAMNLMECVERSLTIQRDYAERQIAEGHRCATAPSDEIRNQLSNYHRVWHNYALGLGYIEESLPWAVNRLKDTPVTQAVYCPDCRERQKDPEQYFCGNCNAPFDALKAFLAGKSVSPDRLAVYEGKEWKSIVVETQRRRAKIAMLEEPKPSGKQQRAVEETPAPNATGEQQGA